jgi:hypothetical protein
LTEKLPGIFVKLTGMEDVLKKLNELTNDEARMATAQVLRSRSLRTVNDSVTGIDHKLAYINDTDQLEGSSMSYLH